MSEQRLVNTVGDLRMLLARLPSESLVRLAAPMCVAGDSVERPLDYFKMTFTVQDDPEHGDNQVFVEASW